MVQGYLEDECSKGRVLGPFPPQALEVHVSRFGVIPNKGVNKWRPILDLSLPDGSSVNDRIQPELCSLAYVSVDDAARASARAGQGALLAKIDCLLPGLSPPRGQATPGHGLGRRSFRGHRPAIWPAVSPKDLHRPG